MVVPEHALLPALDRDNSLIESALKNDVVLVTPATLMVILNAVNLMWKQDEMAKAVKVIGDLSTDLHSKLSTFASHYQKVGKELDGAINAYNSSVGSWDRRLMPAVERLEETGAKSGDIPSVKTTDGKVCELPSPEEKRES